MHLRLNVLRLYFQSRFGVGARALEILPHEPNGRRLELGVDTLWHQFGGGDERLRRLRERLRLDVSLAKAKVRLTEASIDLDGVAVLDDRFLRAAGGHVRIALFEVLALGLFLVRAA